MELESTQPFELIETMLHSHRIVYLDQHLKRLQRSADYFEISLAFKLLHESLLEVEKTLRTAGRHKVRVTVRKNGDFRIALSPLTRKTPPFRSVCISPHRVDPDNIYYYHKTTRRTLYNSEYDRVAANGYYEVLFLNEEGYIAEGSRSNVFVRIDGRYYTPPLSSGLLPGVYRQLILNQCPGIQEKLLTLEDVRQSERLYVCNAVSGLQRIHQIDFNA